MTTQHVATYHDIMAGEIIDRRGYSPLDCEAEHDLVLLTVARSSKRVRGAIARAAENLRERMERAEHGERAALNASGGETEWQAHGGPDLVIEAAYLRTLYADSLALCGRWDEARQQANAGMGYMTFSGLATILTYAQEA